MSTIIYSIANTPVLLACRNYANSPVIIMKVVIVCSIKNYTPLNGDFILTEKNCMILYTILKFLMEKNYTNSQFFLYI